MELRCSDKNGQQWNRESGNGGDDRGIEGRYRMNGRGKVDEKDGQVETEREEGIGKGGKQRREVQRKWLQSRCIEKIVTNKEGITENNDVRQKEI